MGGINDSFVGFCVYAKRKLPLIIQKKGNNILFDPNERCKLKKTKGCFESNGCEIRRRIGERY